MTKGLVLLTMAAAFSFGAIVQIAWSGHYHTFNNVTHGLVHGSSNTDGSFFSRTYGAYIAGANQCAVGHTANGSSTGWTYAATTTYGGNLCTLWSYRYGNYWDECRGFSYNRVAFRGGGRDFLRGHNHGPHNFYSPCPVRGS